MSMDRVPDENLQDVCGGLLVNKDGSYNLDLYEVEALRDKGYDVEAVFNDEREPIGPVRGVTGYVVFKMTDNGEYKEIGKQELKNILW